MRIRGTGSVATNKRTLSCEVYADRKQERLLDNIVRAMQGVPEEIVLRQIGHFTKADPAFSEGVAKRLAAIKQQHQTPRP